MLLTQQDLLSGKETLESLFVHYGIETTLYPDRIVFNYNQISSYSSRFERHVRECRNLILSRDYKQVLHRSFDRFFNIYEEPDAPVRDFSHAVCQEKLDGSFIGCYHDGKSWCYCTRSRAFAEGKMGTSNDTFVDFIKKNCSFPHDMANKKYSYIFELMSPYNINITPVQETSLTLLAVREKESGNYIDEKEEGIRLGYLHFPTEYHFTSFDDCIQAAKNLPQHEEGYVVRFGNERVKVKNPAFLALSRSKTSRKEVLQKIAVYEEEEIFSYFPELKAIYKPYIRYREELPGYFYSLYEKYHVENRKEFSMKIQHLPSLVKAVLFLMADRNASFFEAYKSLACEKKCQLLELLGKRVNNDN